MRTICNCLLLVLVVAFTNSCLKSGLDELETFDQNDITNVRFEYRWWDEAGKRLRVVELETEKSIDNEKKEIHCTINVPAASNALPANVREQISLRALAVNVDASTAARISPVGGAPVMGTFPSDFSAKKFMYKVVAGNGDEAVWTILISDFKK